MDTNFRPEDFKPLDSFSLIWRWTQETHNLLPPEVLADIQPLTQAKADDLWDGSESLHGHFAALPRLSESELAARQVLSIYADPAYNFEEVQAWLRALPVDGNSLIIVFWDSGKAVVTSWHIFCTYWDDFCYPNDTVFVWPLAGHWAIEFWRDEVFYFAEHLDTIISNSSKTVCGITSAESEPF